MIFFLILGMLGYLVYDLQGQVQGAPTFRKWGDQGNQWQQARTTVSGAQDLMVCTQLVIVYWTLTCRGGPMGSLLLVVSW